MERLAGATQLVANDAEANTLAARVYAGLRTPEASPLVDPDVLNADV